MKYFISENMINYVIKFKNSQNYNFTVKILLILFILSLFFPIRHVFLTKEAYLTGIYSDFTSFSFYLSDILLIILGSFTVFRLIQGKKEHFNLKSLILNPFLWLILAIFIVFLIYFGLNMRLNSYLLLKWLELFVAYGTFKVLFRENNFKSIFLKLFAWLCGLESVFALVQFARQSSLGLYRLGESHLAPNILGVAKIVSGGTAFIRGYGTFTHPNPFSAFLVAGVLISIYLYIEVQRAKGSHRSIYAQLITLNVLGLAITFSRGAYLALATGLIIFFGSWFLLPLLSKERLEPALSLLNGEVINKRVIFAASVCLLSFIISFFLFEPFLLTRATFSDQATMDRKFYDATGVKMALANPIFGVGLGESLLHMEQYSGKILAPWDKQPPHNYFILAASELGIPTMLILVWIFLSHLWGLIKKIKITKNYNLTTNYYLLTSIFCSFLLLMQFDHYFYDLNQTQLLLWIFLALIAAEIKITSPKEER